MVERRTSPSDRRVTQIQASGVVREFMATRSAELTLHPLLDALGRASPRQRRSIGKGIDTLAHLLLGPNQHACRTGSQPPATSGLR
jgi:hypothetical protein